MYLSPHSPKRDVIIAANMAASRRAAQYRQHLKLKELLDMLGEEKYLELIGSLPDDNASFDKAIDQMYGDLTTCQCAPDSVNCCAACKPASEGIPYR